MKEFDLNDPISEKGFSHAQHDQWRNMIHSLKVTYMLILPPARLETWRQAVENINYWQPDLQSFQARLELAQQLIIKGKHPTLVEHRVCEGEQSFDAMRCMRQGCAEGRSRPFLHHIKWWTLDDPLPIFEEIWSQYAPYLKEKYRGPLWKKRIKEYGLYLCYPHYAKIYRAFHRSSSEELPCEKWYSPQAKKS